MPPLSLVQLLMSVQNALRTSSKVQFSWVGTQVAWKLQQRNFRQARRAFAILMIGTLSALVCIEESRACVDKIFPGTLPVALRPGQGRWRPSKDDVDRISHGQAAKVRGTGSRAVPHRLTIEEHAEFKRAKARGFLEMGGGVSRSRSQRTTRFVYGRTGSALWNIYRNWCDALAVPLICIHKGHSGVPDKFRIDVSPVRPDDPLGALRATVDAAASLGVSLQIDAGDIDGEQIDLTAAQETLPIHKVPELTISTHLPRSVGKTIAKELSKAWGCSKGHSFGSGHALVDRDADTQKAQVLPRNTSDDGSILHRQEPGAPPVHIGEPASMSELRSHAEVQQELEAIRLRVTERKGDLIWAGMSRKDANKDPEIVQLVQHLRKLTLQERAAARRQSRSAAYDMFAELS